MKSNYIAKVFSILGLFLIGCTSFNAPFIDIDNTLKLHEGLTIEQTKSILGNPLVVKSGDSNSNEIIWIYEVRTIEVMSGKSSKGDPIPNKTHSITRHGDPIHYLTIHFIDNKVSSWESYSSQDKSNSTDDTDASDGEGDDNDEKDDSDQKDSDDNESTSGKSKKKKRNKNTVYTLRVASAMGEFENATFGLRVEKKINEKLALGIQTGMHDWGAGMWYGLYAVRPIMKKGIFEFSQLVGLSNWGRYVEGEDYWEGGYWEYRDSEYKDSFGLLLEERFDFLTPINGLSIDLNLGVVTGSQGGAYIGSGIAYSF